jgi:hypothetical protein
MLLNFSIDKAISATAYMIEREGGTENMFPLLKKLYYADRTALIQWGQSITGDKLVSMEKGPVVSGIYNLMKGEGEERHQIKWEDAIHRTQPYTITIRKKPSYGVLSKREMEALDSARETINAIRGSIPKWLHRNCPEWSDPGKSSSTIDPSEILRLAKKTEEEIRHLEEANEELRLLTYLLQSR